MGIPKTSALGNFVVGVALKEGTLNGKLLTGCNGKGNLDPKQNLLLDSCRGFWLPTRTRNRKNYSPNPSPCSLFFDEINYSVVLIAKNVQATLDEVFHVGS